MKNVYTYTLKGREYERLFTKGGIKQSIARILKYTWRSSKPEDFKITEYELVKVRDYTLEEFNQKRIDLYQVVDIYGVAYLYSCVDYNAAIDAFKKEYPDKEIHIVNHVYAKKV